MENRIFKNTNLEYCVDYDYERSSCSCDADYCRCTTIDHAWVSKVDVCLAIKELYRKYSKTNSYIDEYCFDRICYAFKIYDKDLYEVDIGAGYYGEEVYGVHFKNEDKIIDTYDKLLELNTNIDKIKYCLELEYGYLIERVKSTTTATIADVLSDSIKTPQTEYYIKVDKNVIEEYKNRDLPVAVCIRDGNYYRLIDGYHRYVANKERDNVSIVVLE